MKILDLLKGKKVKVMTDARVEVELEIESAEERKHSRDLEPATQANDWWPKSEDWTTIRVEFTNGFVKTYKNLNQINLVDDELEEEKSGEMRWYEEEPTEYYGLEYDNYPYEVSYSDKAHVGGLEIQALSGDEVPERVYELAKKKLTQLGKKNL
jgi:hypothetical protein